VHAQPVLCKAQNNIVKRHSKLAKDLLQHEFHLSYNTVVQAAGDALQVGLVGQPDVQQTVAEILQRILREPLLLLRPLKAHQTLFRKAETTVDTHYGG
jgi:hypothetical protein